jgi:O-antigen ligase
LPFFIELIDAKWLIALPGLPYSLGKLVFILFGISSLKWRTYKLNKIDKAYLLLCFSVFIGSFFGNDFEGSISRAFGTFPIIIAAIGFGHKLRDPWFRKMLNLIFVVTLAYWVYYVVNRVFFQGSVLSYSTLFNEEEAVNHHIPGINLSCMCIFVIANFFVKKNKILAIGWWIALCISILIILIQSRSNLIFFLLGIILLMFLMQSKNLIRIVSLVIVLAGGFFVVQNLFLNKYDFLSQRFDFSDTEYLETTNTSRLELYESFIPRAISSPLGRGITDVKVILPNRTTPVLMHNQYATFMLAGGILALYVVIIIFRSLFYYVKRVRSNQGQYSNNLLAYLLTAIVFYSTMLTIEVFGSGLSIIFISILSYIDTLIMNGTKRSSYKHVNIP